MPEMIFMEQFPVSVDGLGDNLPSDAIAGL